MGNTKAVSNEEIIAAILQHGTIRDAATAAGTTPRTIYDRMKDSDFRAEYMAAKTDIVRGAVFSMNARLAEAVDAVAGIMNDPDTNPAVRLQAAQTIINNATKFTERLALEEYKNRTEGEPFSGFAF